MTPLDAETLTSSSSSCSWTAATSPLIRCASASLASPCAEIPAPIASPASRAAASRASSCDAAPSTPSRNSRSEEHTSELQSLMRISYAAFCLQKKTHTANPRVHGDRTRDVRPQHAIDKNTEVQTTDNKPLLSNSI